MRRLIIGVTLIAIPLAVAAPGGLAAGTSHHITAHFLGAAISANKEVYVIRGTISGAGVQTLKANSKGGTDTAIIYTANGTASSKDVFTLGKPNKAGVVTIKGHGHFTRGTGRYAGITGHYTFTGTFNSKTTITKVSLSGTASY
jgi:hypothetical protein